MLNIVSREMQTTINKKLPYTHYYVGEDEKKPEF